VLIIEVWKSFLLIGLLSIGGGYATIPLIRQQIVEQMKWLTMQELTDIITVSQMTPGPLAVNASTFVGLRVAGLPGAVAATFGCIISGVLISLSLYRFFRWQKENPVVANVLRTLQAASVGLIGAAAAVILGMALAGSEVTGNTGGINITAVAVFAAAMLLLRKWKMNPVLMLVLTGVSGIFIY